MQEFKTENPELVSRIKRRERDAPTKNIRFSLNCRETLHCNVSTS
ncbi:MAG: hypothetical protein AAF316_11780 [Cyanobacteria bacterium P01_A01_bin.80]